jgi:uncharacterized protein YecT (DUF1311 family)
MNIHSMRHLILFCVLCVSTAYAAVDERAVRAMLSAHTGFTEEQIRGEIAKGCGGGGDMAICAWYSYFQADVGLNDTYQKAMKWLNESSSREALRDTQRAWIAYREASCRFETVAWEGGSFRYVATASC